MLRIGDAAKRFDISKRTLRYWEDEGILSSVRAENGYRYYDAENAMRIRQIVLLRKLEMPIAEIERIFITNAPDTAIHSMQNHLENLRQDAYTHFALAAKVEELLQKITSERSLTQVFAYLESHAENILPEQKKAPQIILSEREKPVFINQESHIRIVRLPAMRVASYRAESEAPEQDCAAVMNRFVLENKLHKKSGFRHFGFNNPNPSEDTPVYGYEMWVSVPEDFAVPAPLTQKDFAGGLYVSIVASLGDIDERWQQLGDWISKSGKYVPDTTVICMEECLDFETLASGNDGEMQLDLLLPVKERTGGKAL